MFAIIRLYFDICRLRTSPAEVPASALLAVLTVTAYALLGLLIATLEQRLAYALLTTLIDVVMLLALAYLALWVRDLRPRAVQTITALAGTGTLFSLLGLPLMLWLQRAGDNPSALASVLLIVLIIWNIAVIGHILRHALALPTWAGMGIAVLYVYTSLRVMSALFAAGA
jgi:hypothetical protein